MALPAPCSGPLLTTPRSLPTPLPASPAPSPVQPADVMHKYEEEAAACRERCMRLFFSCCVPAAFLWLLADAVCAAAFMYGVPLPSLWSLINAKAGVIQAALSFVLSIDAWRGHCAKRMSQAAHRRLQRLSSSSS